MIKKEHDWFLENMLNSDFTNSEFKTVGINANNTSLQDADFYKNNPKIREYFTTANGNFDEQAFNQMYQKALYSYNALAQDTWVEDLSSKMEFSQNDIFVDIKQRRQSPELFINFQGVPFYNGREYVSSISTLGKNTPTGRSLEEVAQTQKVFDPSTNTWSDSPNDSFFNDFFETRVIAAWDYDADINGNPTDDLSKIVYHKGDIKLNNAGLPYYENLNERSVVGKTVLHKSDVLTTDGSFWNKFDIFDSDDIETSVYKTVLKNVAMVAPLLAAPLGAPIIAHLYLGAGIAMSLADVFNTGAKMILGSEVNTLNNVEGFIDSLQLSPAKTEAKSMWNLNNLIDLAGQVFLQLSQQRWIFKYAPVLFSGTTNAEKLNTKNFNNLKKELLSKFEDTEDFKDVKWLASFKDEWALLDPRAERLTHNQLQQFQKIGEEISRLYMTGIVAAEGYNQAKADGLSDGQAAAFTLGYSIFEYGILKTDIGKWILPELKTDRAALNKALQVTAKPMQYALEKSGAKSEAVKTANTFIDWMKKGMQKASIDNRIGKSMGQFALANALSEGIEETSEELLLDFTKGLFNTYYALTGDDSRFKMFENWKERYTMSFVGGMLGGGMFSLTPDVKRTYESIRDMSIEQATTELLSRVRNGEAQSIYKIIGKNTWGNPYLSYTTIKDRDGNLIHTASDKENSQDALVKTMLVNQVQDMERMLSLHGANITDDRLIDVIDEFKFVKIAETQTSKRFINDFSSELSKLYSKQVELNNKLSINGRPKDDAPDAEKQAYEKSINALQKEIDEHSKNIKAFIEGEKSSEYIMDAMFESQNILSKEFIPDFVSYLQYNGIDYKNLSKEDINKHLVTYSAFVRSNRADNVHKYREIFDSIIDKVSPNINEEFIDNVRGQSLLARLLGERISKLEEKALTPQLAETYIPTLNEYALSSIIDAYYGDNTYNELLKPLLQEGSNLKEQVYTLTQNLKNNPDNIQLRQQLQQALEAESLYSESFEYKFKSLIFNKLNQIVDPSELLVGLNESTQSILIGALEQLQDMDIDPFEGTANFHTLKRLIKLAPTTGGAKLLKNIQISLNSELDVNALVTELEEEVLTKKDLIGELKFNDEITSRIQDAIKFIGLAQAVIYAHKKDIVLNKEEDFIFGYNEIRNQLFGTSLNTIDNNIVDSIIKELEQLKNHIQYLKNLSDLNRGRKLKIQKNTSINVVRLLAKKIEKLARLLTNWEDVNRLNEALESANLILKNDSFDQIDEIEFERQRAAIEIAVHEVFKKNITKLDNLEEMSKIFSLDNFNFIHISNEDITDVSKTIDDTSFFWYLAALVCTNPNDYNFKYKSILNGKFAPLITQEIAAFIGYSQLTNSKLFKKFVDIKNESIINYKGSDIPYVISKEYAKDSAVYTRFGDVTFVNGVPGAGKTTATIYIITHMLGENHPLLENAIFISPNKEALSNDGRSRAEISATNAGIKITNPTTQVLTRQEVLNKYFPNYLDKFEVTTVTQNLKEGYKKDLQQIDGIYKITNVETNTSAELPSMFIIDEISLWSTFDFDVLHDLCEQHNIPIIVLGDPQQTPLTGQTEINDIVINAKIEQGNFINTPKISISMRTTNKPLSDSLLAFRQAIISRENNKPENNITTNYYEDDNNLVGVRILASDETDEIIRVISKMNKLKSEGDTIGLITLDEDSSKKLFEETLSKEPFFTSLQSYPGVSSSGVESDYFVVYVDADAGIDLNRLKQLYTGTSRTLKGTLIIVNGESDLIESKTNTLQQEGYSEEEIKAFSDSRLEVLNKIYTIGNSLNEYQVSQSQQSGSILSEDTVITDNEQINKNSTTTYSVSEDNEERAVEMDAYTEMDNNLTQPTGPHNRINGLFGLSNIFNQGNKSDVQYRNELITQYYLLKSIFKYGKSLEDIQTELQKIPEFIGCEVKVAIKKSVQNPNLNPNQHPRFKYEPNEIVSEIGNPNGTDTLPTEHTCITFVVSKNGNDILDIPLYRINNFASYAKYQNNSLLYILKSAINESDIDNMSKAVDIIYRKGTKKIIEPLEEYYKNNPIPQLYNLISLLKIWETHTDFIFKLDNNSANNFLANRKSTGPFISVENIVGGQNSSDYNPELTDMEQLFTSRQFKFSEVYIHTNTNNLGIKVGMPFIIITDNMQLDQNSLYNLYEQNPNREDLTLLYITLPSIEIPDYIQHKIKVIRKQETFNKQFGNQVTDIKLLYHTLSILLKKLPENTTYENGQAILDIITPIYKQFWDSNGKRNPGVSTDQIIKTLNEVDSKLCNLTGNSGKSLSISSCCSDALINAFGLFSSGKSTPSEQNILKVYEIVESDLSKVFPYGIFVDLRIKKDESTSSLRTVADINQNFTISIGNDNYPLHMFGKIEPTRVMADWTSFFKLVNGNNPNTNGDFSNYQDYLQYTGQSVSETTETEAIKPEVNTGILEYYINQIGDEELKNKLIRHSNESVNNGEDAAQIIQGYLGNGYKVEFHDSKGILVSKATQSQSPSQSVWNISDPDITIGKFKEKIVELNLVEKEDADNVINEILDGYNIIDDNTEISMADLNGYIEDFEFSENKEKWNQLINKNCYL